MDFFPSAQDRWGLGRHIPIRFCWTYVKLGSRRLESDLMWTDKGMDFIKKNGAF